jgi:hypothetical protein
LIVSTVTTSSIISSATPSTFTSLASTTMATSGVVPKIPGFSWESIIVGISISLVVLGIIRRRRRQHS